MKVICNKARTGECEEVLVKCACDEPHEICPRCTSECPYGGICEPSIPEYVRVTGCAFKTFWYSDRVGETFRVKKDYDTYYTVDSRHGDSIYKKDCEPCEDPKENLLYAVECEFKTGMNDCDAKLA